MLEDTLFEVNILIEIPKDSNIKYEMNVKIGVIVVDRVLTVKMIYPSNYGYIINTREQDGDHMDAFVLGNYSLTPGSINRSRPVGVVLSQLIRININIIPTQSHKSNKIHRHLLNATNTSRQIYSKFWLDCGGYTEWLPKQRWFI